MSRHKLLTDIAIAKLSPRAVRYEVPDPGARGLRVIVQPSGRKSYAVRYRNLAGRARKYTLPAGITLAAARKLAADALLEVAQGRDPAVDKRKTRRAAAKAADARERDTVEWLANQFLEQHAKRATRENSWRATVGIFKNIVLPAWGAHSVHDVARRDVRDLLDNVAADRPVMANRVKAALSKFFGWLAGRDVIAASPCIGVPAPTKEVPRERVLSDDELRRLWLATETIGGAAACIKLLILTGARRSEIAQLKWSEVDGNALVLPAERMKGKTTHVIPLSTQAAAIITALPRTGDYLFGANPVSHFDRLKRELDMHMGSAPRWVVHDIRRTAVSGMARIGVALPVIEKILAHRGGTFKGIVGVYQKHSFLPEMTIALQKWSDHVERLVGACLAQC